MKKAYTLIELLVVIGILAILTGLSSLSMVSYSKASEMETTKSIVWQALLQARANSMAVVDGKTWGVYLEQNRITLFADSGSGYNSHDGLNQVKSFANNTTINWSVANGTVEFAKRTGEASSTGQITVIGNASANITININSQGNIY